MPLDVKLSRESAEPLYKQIVRQVRDAVRDGTLQPNEALPRELELAAQLAVNTRTVGQALRQLAEESLVYRVKRKGTFVSDAETLRAVLKRTRRVAVGYRDSAYLGNPLAVQSLLHDCVELATDVGLEVTFYKFPDVGVRASAGALYRAIADRVVDGLLLVSPLAAEDELWLHQQNMPFVLLFNSSSNAQTHTVLADYSRACELSVGFLKRLGFANIHVVFGGDGIYAAEPLAHMRQAFARLGLALPAESQHIIRWGERSGRDFAERLLASGPLPDALVVAEDYMALGVMNGLLRHGVRVPEDISILQFDDRIAADLYPVSPTCLCMDSGACIKRALNLIEQLLAGREAPSPRLIEPYLVVRESCRVGL